MKYNVRGFDQKIEATTAEEFVKRLQESFVVYFGSDKEFMRSYARLHHERIRNQVRTDNCKFFMEDLLKEGLAKHTF